MRSNLQPQLANQRQALARPKIGAMGTDGTFILHGRPGWGSAIVEAQLAFYGLPFTMVEHGDLFDSEDARSALRPLNPLTQVPTLVLPDGQVMTESAAITLHLADLAGSDALVPGPQAAERAAFLRWLVYLVANVYPTFTYADIPERFVKDAAAAPAFAEELGTYRRRLWGIVEGAAGLPWLLGDRMTALDIYLAVMTHWGPRKPWFADNAPRLTMAAQRAAALPAVAPVIARNFPSKPAAPPA
jgi:GST-like protein